MGHVKINACPSSSCLVLTFSISCIRFGQKQISVWRFWTTRPCAVSTIDDFVNVQAIYYVGLNLPASYIVFHPFAANRRIDKWYVYRLSPEGRPRRRFVSFCFCFFCKLTIRKCATKYWKFQWRRTIGSRSLSTVKLPCRRSFKAVCARNKDASQCVCPYDSVNNTGISGTVFVRHGCVNYR